ncbi:hypothetical protein CkaCkLH20_00262 [Colletotrichum karsti]|uniref:Ecp2 effector protein domain-containing protein n=1 Tax=Colletotrichum karsti TaxID=1095194 RepID=A0A9P6LQV3_9PEZI|nr:uncharacterized protein CkaCkLH20_00262 [Colletotrichum karsti]KAF9882226.1 hypothetical protein CkaCkLH20_00262 [Colletotrichum karsti]
MRPSQVLSAVLMGGGVSAAAVEVVTPLRTCLIPEPDKRICYSEAGGTPQGLDLKEVQYTADYLRAYQEQQLSIGGSPFWKMPLPEANNCGEWQVTSKGRTWVMAKLVGEQQAGVLFSDIAATIDGFALEDPTRALLNCSNAGGQMGTIVDTENPLYQTQLFEGFTNKGIIIKLVRSPI